MFISVGRLMVPRSPTQVWGTTYEIVIAQGHDRCDSTVLPASREQTL
jgi:hypothetical protein